MNWNRAIGGYFELELNDFGTIYHDNLIKLNSGRNALEYILIQEGYEKVYVPYYTCDVTLQPLKRQNIDKYMHLLARNWMQVKNSDAIYAIGEIKNNIVAGGTGWAVQMAIDNNKQVYVFDQNKNNWYYWNGKFEYCNTPVLVENYAGIGTRDINENGIKAIINVYKKTKTI